MSLELFVLAIAVINVVVVLEFVRRRKLAESFALLWSGVAVGGMLLVVLRPLIDRFSKLVGVEAGTSVVFSLGILFLVIVSMYLSVHITALEDKVESLAEELAMMRGIRRPESGSTGHGAPDALGTTTDDGRDHDIGGSAEVPPEHI
ncbi:MAG: DUF2304 domain-containing protein [Actinobacteria bacterium]|nr:DUF2304 domain-containing protein [Actinomycetota bacterium]